MTRRRSYKTRLSRESSYFTTCKHCGVKIHMRQMPYDQWVAFDGPEIAHRCGRGSDYDDLSFQKSFHTSSLCRGDTQVNNPGFESAIHKHKTPNIKKLPSYVWPLLRSPVAALSQLILIAIALPMLVVPIFMMALAGFIGLVFRYWWGFLLLAIFYDFVIRG